MAEKRPRGQPTKYRPEYCQKVIAWGKRGKSLEWMCAELGVVYNTLAKLWPAANPEFAAALELAKLHAQKWWEDAGQNGMGKREFNSQVWSRSMAARFPEKWRESKTTELTGKDGAPIGGSFRPDLSRMTEEQKLLLASIPLIEDEEEPQVRH